MTPPTGPSPMSAQPQEGLRAQATRRIAEIVKGLIDVVGMLRTDINSAEGKAALSALRTLAPVVPDVSEGLSRTEALAALARTKAVQPGGGGGMFGIRPPGPNVIAGAPMMGR